MSSPAETLLRKRAKELARAEEEVLVQRWPLTLFRRGGLLVGIRVAEVHGAGTLRLLSPVPGAPAYVSGTVFHRGEVLTLIDLPAFWEMELRGIADLPTYVVVSDGPSRIGVLVEDLLGVHDLEVPPSPWKGAQRAGITEVSRRGDEAVMVLSAPSLFADPRLRGGLNNG